jgi:hypothetical protein
MPTLIVFFVTLLTVWGVAYGWFSVSGSQIHDRPYGRDDAPGGADFDQGVEDTFASWGRGTR